jgi:glycosyltransferase involved in cell wall biosynthesis
MRVTIDIQAAIAQRAGVGRYTKSLVEHLGRYQGCDELQLFYFDFQRKGVQFPVPGADSRVIQWCPGRIIQKAWKTIHWPPYNWFAGVSDVYHFPNFVRPPLTKGKSMVTIHDIAFIRHPQTLEPRNLKYLTAQIEQTVQNSDRIIAVSEFTAREIHELLGVPSDRIIAIHEGLPDGFARPEKPRIDEARRILKLERPYLLTVGTLEPRKNMAFLVEVFEKLTDFEGDLVIAGRYGWKYEPILKRILDSPRANRIRHLRYVDERLLPSLYTGAELFIFPSLYEGFGFPPLESMACGTPVLSSTGGSLPEVLGDAAEFVPDYDSDAWADKARKLLSDKARRTDLIFKGAQWIKKYSWDETARKTWDIYRDLST